jgi:DNA-binding XRE family transcriptional regulator
MRNRPSRDYTASEEGAKLMARLRWYLATSGETQTQAAKAIGVSQATLHHWLVDQMSPDSERRVKIRRFLKSAND